MTRKLRWVIMFLLVTYMRVSGQSVYSTSPISLPSGGSPYFVVSSGQSANITSTQSVVLHPGVILSSGSYTHIWIDGQVPVTQPPTTVSGQNWVQSRSYDENGVEVSASRQYFDYNGAALQLQTRSETNNQILASQPLYDFQRRSVGSTLAAPINSSQFSYKDLFVTAGGTRYNYQNFDGNPSSPTTIYSKQNSPDAVDNTTKGTLGWYYSNNNTDEPLVAATSYPYSRVDFYTDGTNEVRRTGGVGDQLRLGGSHETTGNTFPVQNELNNYMTIRNQFFPSAVSGGSPGSLEGQAVQSLSTDQNGTTVMKIADKSGNVLMSGRADGDAAWLTASNTFNISNVKSNYRFWVKPGSFGSGINSLNITSLETVTVYCTSCSTTPTVIYNNKGNDYVYTPTATPQTYLITSNYPFTVNESLITTSNPSNVTPPLLVYDQASAEVAEPTGSSIAYFRLTKPSVVTLSGGSYSLYDMGNSATVPLSFSSGSSLAAGYYKVIASQSTNDIDVNTVTVSYTNKYSDISYNYYNQLGQLIGSIAPNGVQALLQQSDYSGYASAAQLPFVSLYQYDLKGRMISSSSPDAGTANFIYRQDGKVRFSQNAYQANAANSGSGQERFSYTNYDDIGRPVESGEYTTTAGTFASLVNNATVLEAVDAGGGLSISTKQDWVKSHYDLPDNSHGLSGYIQDEGFLKGGISWTENENAKSWYNYDDRGRVTWVIKQINGLGNKTLDYVYNSQGNVSKVDYQKDVPAERFIHYYDYDADSRLVNVKTSRNDVDKLQQAKYYYYLHGPLKRTELADQLQGIDYVYTAQGWLKSINGATGDPAKDPHQDGVANSFAKDAFGMQLEYFSGDYSRSGSNVTSITTGSQQYYNGNVNGLSWQSNKPQAIAGLPGIQNPLMYNYTYDPKYQLTSATYGTPDFGGGTFTASSINKEDGISYDANGNIKSLQRTHGVGAVDDLGSYQYQAGTNKLNNVGSAASPASYASYTYDELGRLKSQQLTGGNSMYFKYDVSGKVTAVYSDPSLSTASLRVSYSYDENGNRISRTDYNGSPVTSYYVYDGSGSSVAIYNGSTLAEVPVYGSDRLGTYTTSDNNYVYEMRDNVGSVRVVLNRTRTGSGQADIVNYADYFPYGSVISNSGTVYRYQYQGAYAEKDDATKYNNFDLRMYDSMIGRWTTTDPKGQYPSSYEGMGNNPVIGVDKTGGVEEKPDGEKLSDPGDWHKSDRLNNTDVWKNANLYNLKNGNSDQYHTITQRDDFYKWFADAIRARGFDNMWPAAASVVAWNMGFLDNPVMAFIVGSDVVKFGNDGNKAIFDDVFDNLAGLYNGPIMKGKVAAEWDAKTLHHEQFDVAQPLYLKQSASTIKTLSKMSKGQSIYGYGTIEALRFHGDILNPQDRYNYGSTKVVDFVKIMYQKH